MDGYKLIETSWKRQVDGDRLIETSGWRQVDRDDRDNLIETTAGGGRRRTADVEQKVRTPDSDVGGTTSSFWLLGNAKNPTDLKPYWSRAGEVAILIWGLNMNPKERHKSWQQFGWMDDHPQNSVFHSFGMPKSTFRNICLGRSSSPVFWTIPNQTFFVSWAAVRSFRHSMKYHVFENIVGSDFEISPLSFDHPNQSQKKWAILFHPGLYPLKNTINPSEFPCKNPIIPIHDNFIHFDPGFFRSPRCLQQSHQHRHSPSVICCASALSACEKASAWQRSLRGGRTGGRSGPKNPRTKGGEIGVN